MKCHSSCKTPPTKGEPPYQATPMKGHSSCKTPPTKGEPSYQATPMKGHSSCKTTPTRSLSPKATPVIRLLLPKYICSIFCNMFLDAWILDSYSSGITKIEIKTGAVVVVVVW